MTLRWAAFGAAVLIALPACAPPLRNDAVTTAARPAAGDEATGAAKAEAGKPLTNTLRWTTASELDNFGFDVYRGDSEDGPFVRLTDRPVPGAGTSDVPIDYVYVDDTIDPAREYFYYVESISMGGDRLRFTPIMRAPAKR